jgi:hypothetical protein
MSASSWCGYEPPFAAIMPRRNREESIPSLEPTPVGRVRVRRVPALGGILRERGAAQRRSVSQHQSPISRRCTKGVNVMRSLNCVVFAMCLVLWTSVACSQTLTPEQKQIVASLKDDLSRVNKEIEQATQEDAKYSGGLIKSLIAVRLEILKTNAALIEQRI